SQDDRFWRNVVSRGGAGGAESLGHQDPGSSGASAGLPTWKALARRELRWRNGTGGEQCAGWSSLLESVVIGCRGARRCPSSPAHFHMRVVEAGWIAGAGGSGHHGGAMLGD